MPEHYPLVNVLFALLVGLLAGGLFYLLQMAACVAGHLSVLCLCRAWTLLRRRRP